MCSVAFAGVQGVFGNALVTQGRQRVLLRVSGAVLVANALINLAVIPLFGDRGAAGALLLTESLSLVLTLRVYGSSPRPALARTVAAADRAGGSSRGRCGMSRHPNRDRGDRDGIVLGLIAYVAVLIALHALPSYVREPVESLVRSIRLRSAA